MRIRSLVLSSLAAAAWCLTTSAHAGPTGSGGSGGSGGRAGGSVDPNCSIASQQQSGTTCVTCDTSLGLCSDQLGSSYNYVCKSGASSEIWCNGPARSTPADTSVSCAVKVPGTAYDAAAACVLAAAALAIRLRRRRR